MKKAARRIVEKLRSHGHEAFFAGGWVRDFLLRRNAKDIDIATSAHPEQVARLFPKSRFIGAQFGVVQVLMYGHPYEVATFRSDNAYVDGRHPSSVTFTGPEQDALRRDFTINGLFYDPVAERLIDYVHGRADIQNRLIRTIGNPADRFEEDKLRMLRAVRLACTLGFAIVPETWEAVRALAPKILQVSWERIRDELLKIFSGPAPAAGVDLLHGSGLLHHILPEVAASSGVPQSPGIDVFTHTKDAIALLRKPSAGLVLAALLHDAGKQQSPDNHAKAGAEMAEGICRRLRLSNEETGRVVELVAMHADFFRVRESRESTLKRMLRNPNIEEHLELFRANSLGIGRNLDLYHFCIKKLEEYRGQPEQAPLLSGEDLIAMGYAPGPLFKEILRSVEDLQLEGALRTREEALEHVRRVFPL